MVPSWPVALSLGVAAPADSSWLAPVDFTYLLFAAIWSRLLFDQWPTGQAILGMGLIATAGIVTAWRERVVAAGNSS